MYALSSACDSSLARLTSLPLRIASLMKDCSVVVPSIHSSKPALVLSGATA